MVRSVSSGIRGVRRVFRTPLPKYRKNLLELPPLTSLLTSNERPKDFKQLKQEKLLTYKSYIPDNAKVPLLEALFNSSNDIETLLQIIDDNLDTMTSFYIAVSFEALDDFIHEYPESASTIIVAPEFKKLCTKALFKCRHFESDETLKTLKCLATLAMPEDLLIVQAVLQMTRHLINDYNISELNTLMNSLEKLKMSNIKGKTSLATALKRAIPLAKDRLIDGKYFTQEEDYERLT